MLTPRDETPVARALLLDEEGPNPEDPAPIIAELLGLVTNLRLGDDAGAFYTQLTEFEKLFNKLESYLDTDLIVPVLNDLVPLAFDFSDTSCFLLLAQLVDHRVVVEFLISSEILVYLTQNGYWSVECLKTRQLILGFVGDLLAEGGAVVQYFADIGFIELLYHQYEATREFPRMDLDWTLLLRELMRAAESFAAFANQLSPDHCGLLVALADDVISRRESYRGTLSEAVTILRFIVECPDVSVDFLERSPMLSLLACLFEEDYREHRGVSMSFMAACVQRPELHEFIESINVIRFALDIMPVVQSGAELKGLCLLLSSFLSLNPGSVTDLIQVGFFEGFLTAVYEADFNAQREFAGLLLTVLSSVDAGGIYALMSDALVDFFFDLSTADPEMRLLSLQAFWALGQRGVEFRNSAHPFVLGLVEFLDNSPEDLSDLTRAITGLT
jgi:hypothetical protein